MTDFRSDRFHHTVHRFLEAAICPELMPAALHEIAMTCNAAGAIALPVAGDRLIAPVVSEGCAELLVDFLKWPNPARNSRMERGLRLYSRGWRGFATDHDSFTPEELARYEGATKCILCAACTSSCPITWANETFVGPAAIVNAARFIYDSRDEGAAERLRILNTNTGVWRCRTVFNCTDACPRGIEVTRAIEEVKRAILFNRM